MYDTMTFGIWKLVGTRRLVPQEPALIVFHVSIRSTDTSVQYDNKIPSVLFESVDIWQDLRTTFVRLSRGRNVLGAIR